MARAVTRTLLPFQARATPSPEQQPCIPVPAAHFATLAEPAAFRRTLLELIAQARVRILMPVLYLEDDQAGRELLEALYAARAAHPALVITVLMDWHRARRGLIGKAQSEGNAARYREMAERLGPGIDILGLPVQTREMLGVMHLKGFILDDQVLYSGASLNNVYLHRLDRYRLDRYHLINSPQLADSLAQLLTQVILAEPAVQPLSEPALLTAPALRAAISRCRAVLKKARYNFSGGDLQPGEIGITPLLGLGRSDNPLNASVLHLVAQARERLMPLVTHYRQWVEAQRRTIPGLDATRTPEPASLPPILGR